MTLTSLGLIAAESFGSFGVLVFAACIIILFGFVLLLAQRYKRCPSNKVLVIYGKTGAGQSAKCLHGGGSFVWPLIQNYDFLSLVLH